MRLPGSTHRGWDPDRDTPNTLAALSSITTPVALTQPPAQAAPLQNAEPLRAFSATVVTAAVARCPGALREL